jgi:adenosine deaminase
VRRLFDEGIRCTLNTDDTFSFGNRLIDEYEALAEDLSFTCSELAQIARNGFEMADIEPAARIDAETAIDQLLGAA